MKPFSSFNKKKNQVPVGRKLLFFLLSFCLFSSFVFTPLLSPVPKAQAQMAVFDPINFNKDLLINADDKFWDKVWKTLAKAGSVSFFQVLRTALNKVAYDTATWIGTGGQGQQPLFITQDWGAYLKDIGDNVAGEFIQTFVNNVGESYLLNAEQQVALGDCQEGCEDAFESCTEEVSKKEYANFQELEAAVKDCHTKRKNCIPGCTTSINASSTEMAKKAQATSRKIVNVCQPSSLQARLRISLGLSDQSQPQMPNCSATELIQNWGDEAKRLTSFSDQYFLDKVENAFNPTSNDLGIFLALESDLTSQQQEDVVNEKLKLSANKGWTDLVNLAGNKLGVPNAAEKQADLATQSYWNALGETTGDILVDVANIFTNRLGLTAYNRLMANLGGLLSKDSDGSYVSSSISNPSLDSTAALGLSTAQEVISKIIKPSFDTDSDYNVVVGLSSCPNKDNPGPTECVIDNLFMQAITEKKTVAEALKNGYLNKEWTLTKNNVSDAYTLRNISILRKYRVLPAKWEEAVEKINNTTTPKKATLLDLVSCFDPSDEYQEFSKNFNINDSAWCIGLIDPNWVLKAPLSYCAKEGVGSQIIAFNYSEGTNQEGVRIPSVYSLTRNEDYCADEKSCIKENENGSCAAYGYCTEEKRIWNFDSESCDPVYNTCQTFTNNQTRTKVSYLENTLDYQNCNADSVGCSKYSTNGNYSSSTGLISWEPTDSIYLTNASNCSSKSEACTEFIRVKPAQGSNLIMNSDFSEDERNITVTNGQKLNNWPLFYSPNTISSSRRASIDNYTINNEEAAFRISANRINTSQDIISAGVHSNPKNSLLPVNFELIEGQSYTLTADVYVDGGERAVVYLGSSWYSNKAVKTETKVLDSWQTISVTRKASGSYNEPEFGVQVLGSNFVVAYIRNIKFEVSNFSTVNIADNIYGAYRVYQKIIPSYLESVCYVNPGQDYTLKSDAPNICRSFTRYCNASEVGCELFSNDKQAISLSAQVTSDDYCFGDCLGYDVYVSKQDYFHSAKAENIIPSKAKSCLAEAVGCSEFTNLDLASQGGESREYYSQLRQCIKPNTDSCATFYTWETTTNGVELRTYSLQINLENKNEPKVVADDSGECNEEIFNKLPGDPLYNPDCSAFLVRGGSISYHLLSKTVTCSENCYAYRLSHNNIDGTLSRAQCSALGSSANWSTSLNACQVCLNGGTWNSQQGACLYNAIPNEGKACQANQVGCREYNGNDGSNVRLINSYDFETNMQNWSSNCSDALERVTVSNNRDGHSLHYNSDANDCSAVGANVATAPLRLINRVFASDNVAAQLPLGFSVSSDKAYTLSFLARTEGVKTNLNIYLYNNDQANPARAYFTSEPLVISSSGAWDLYQVNLPVLDHEVSEDEVLVITADNDFYFDNVVLREISNRYYLIEGSSQIPDICFYDVNSNYQGEVYNLGCQAYTDRFGQQHNLRKFSNLCAASSVGCEQMIKTQNYNPSYSDTWNDSNNNGLCDSNEPDCVSVSGDEAVYVIYDQSKACNSADLGCSLLGQSLSQGAWSDVFKKNNPNLYDKELCSSAELGCSAWSLQDGTISYFKDPGTNVCQYRNSNNPDNPGKAWYLAPVKRCTDSSGQTNLNSSLCSQDVDCPLGSCVLDNNDYPCEVSYDKTIGLGGYGNNVPTPYKQAALCEQNSSGCTEYIDPVSSISPNLINNYEYRQIDGKMESWINGYQNVAIEPNKLYTFSVSGGESLTELSFEENVRLLLDDNSLGNNTKNISINNGETKNIIFLSLNNDSVRIGKGDEEKKISLRETIINYKLKGDIKKDCTSVNIDNGCVLFNERSVAGSAGLRSLSIDAFSSEEKKALVNCSGDNCSANELIKVTPDRTCAKWLDCLSYVIDDNGEKYCYTIGLCNRLDDKNQCANFEEVNSSIVYKINPNSSGYSLLNQYNLAGMKEVGLNTEAHYDFEQDAPLINCQLNNNSACGSESLLITEPQGSPVNYPAQGETYLKVPYRYIITPHSKSGVSVIENSDYYLNFLVNTQRGGLAVVTIKDAGNGSVIKSENSITANNGWERKIIYFNSGISEKINIELSMGGDSDGAVYFDDLNIEPVLQTGPNSYASRECRLYPTSDSLTCVNKENAVVKNGLEGYCLEHDAANKNVCLLWYPIDKISSAQTAGNTTGYQGKFPLNYCTEVDGNFALKKKVTGYKSSLAIKIGVYTKKGIHYCIEYDNITKDWIESDNIGEISGDKDKENYANLKKDPEKRCLPGYRPIIAFGNYRGENSYGKIMCVPNKDSVILGEKKTVVDMNQCSKDGKYYYDGWAAYDGNLWQQAYSKEISGFCEDYPSDSWCSYSGTFNEADYQNPVRVYDYNRPAGSEDDLELISGSDEDKRFRLGCNDFVQVVNERGENQAWASRVGIGSDYLINTPRFFVDKGESSNVYFSSLYGTSAHNLLFYGRDRDSIPFGAATWPDNFNPLSSQGKITLKDQYSLKNKETIFAGRPYGCSGDNINSCNNIGQCSLNSDVYCLFSPLLKTYVSIFADNKFYAYFNNNILGSGEIEDDVSFGKYQVSLLPLEKNVLAIKATDDESLWGIAASIDDISNTNTLDGWKCTTNKPPDSWNTINFNDSSWSQAAFVSDEKDSTKNKYLSHIKQIWASGVESEKTTVYCRYSFINNKPDHHVSVKSCSEGGYGTCVPLWSKHLGAENSNTNSWEDYQTILSRLFLKIYSSYSFLTEKEMYVTENFTMPELSLGKCTLSTDRELNSCYNLPSIGNMMFNDTSLMGRSSFNLENPGLHRLSFTTNIDPEQQPLKEIIIDWGDGNKQVINGQDSLSDVKNPHIFYHYYKNPINGLKINVKITDNWGYSN